MKARIKKCLRWFARAGLLVAFSGLWACGSQDQEAAPPPAEESPAEAPLSKEELKAVSEEFDLEADEAINEDNLTVEAEKLEKEIAADLE